jgi:hypothetical protein
MMEIMLAHSHLAQVRFAHSPVEELSALNAGWDGLRLELLTSGTEVEL